MSMCIGVAGAGPAAIRWGGEKLMSSYRLSQLILAVIALAIWAATAVAQSELADAAERGDLRAVRSLLRANSDVDAAQPDGMTALLWAVQNNNLEMADRLLRAGADSSAANRTGVTPLYLAAMNASAEMIARLIEAGADPNAIVTGEQESVLMLAAFTGNPEAVRVLLDAGADVNQAQMRGQTAIMWAASEGHTEVVRLLAARGADVGAQSIASTRPERRPAGGMTALLFAARQGHIEAARALIEAGADVNVAGADNTSPLLIALVNGHYELAYLLLEHGADPNVADAKGRAPLFAVIDLRNQQWSQGPAPKLPQAEHMAMIEALVEAGADLEQKLTGEVPHRGSFDMRWTELVGGTPFLRAAWNGDLEVMNYLLAHGADPYATTDKNETALLLLCGSGWPLGQGYLRSEDEIMGALQMLVTDFDMDVNAATTEGITPLMGAVFRGDTHIMVAEYLIEHGAKLDAEDNEGRSVYRWTLGVAANMGQPPRPQPEAEALIVASLEERGLPVTVGSGGDRY
jgi:ankyrin repeat protein